jgi:hypothetical protein
MSYVNDSDQQRVYDKSEPSRQAGQGELQCMICHLPVPGALCGRKSPCPGCGYPYPLGDCSDLAEN